MNYNINIVGAIEFDGARLNVYSSLDEPIFSLREIVNVLGYDEDKTRKMLEMCENDEVLHIRATVANSQYRTMVFVTELGLYNILSRSQKLIARKWRRIIHNEMIRTRKEKGMTIVDQFDEWDNLLDTIYYDEETDMLMQSVTVAGGDVEQIPYVEEDDIL